MQKRLLLTHLLHIEAAKKVKVPKSIQLIHCDSKSKLFRELSHADGIVCLLTQTIDRTFLKRAPELKVIGNMAIGVDNIDLAECAQRKIVVTNTPDVLTKATAQTALALLLAVARRISEGENLCRSGKFKGWAPDMLLGLQLDGRKATIVGKGRIGNETARLFKALGMQIQFITKNDSTSLIQKKLRSTQVLSLHLPYSASTKHWLNASRLALLPGDAIVINTSRGGVIDERSLITSLQKKKIFGAGLDVFEHEPEIPKALKDLDNVVLLPHLGSATRETRLAMATLAVRGSIDVLVGKRPANLVKLSK